MTDFTFDAVWAHYERDSLRERYGVGTYVAVIDAAVIEWGPDAAEVRQRAEHLMGESVYVGSVSGKPGPESGEANDHGAEVEYHAYKAVREGWRPRRRFRMMAAFEKMDELRLIGVKTEYIGGRFVDRGAERRFSDHDYRLLIEHGAVPKDTILVAGIVFWQHGMRESDR